MRHELLLHSVGTPFARAAVRENGPLAHAAGVAEVRHAGSEPRTEKHHVGSSGVRRDGL